MEWDLVTIGDRMTFCSKSCVDNHLFEDRVMKFGHIEFGRECNIGFGSRVLYHTKTEDNVDLGDSSVVMRGENLNTGIWQGAPVEFMRGINLTDVTPIMDGMKKNNDEKAAELKEMSSLNV